MAMELNQSTKPETVAWNKSFASVVARQPVNDVSLVTPGVVSLNNVVNNSLRNQGIAFDSLEENVPTEVYLDALCKNVPTNSITHISKSSRMINVYFTSSTWADQLIRDGLDVKDFHLDVRPIATTPIKVIVSNVPPEIGHQFLRQEMNKYGRVVGPIKTLSAATSRPEYSHIRSFRRMLLIEFANDVAMNKLPKQMNFTLDGKPYSFYTSLDVKCFKCGKMGHFRKSCPGNESASFSTAKVVIPNTLESDTKPKELPKESTKPENQSQVVQLSEENTKNQPDIDSLPSTSSALQFTDVPTLPENRNTKNIPNENSPKKKKKKLKRNASSPDATITVAKVPAKEHAPVKQSEDDSVTSAPSSECEDLDSDTSFGCSEIHEPGLLDNFTQDSPLSVQSLVQFLGEVKGSPHRLRVARKFTDDIGGLVNQVKQLAHYLKKCPIKSKVLSQPRVFRVYQGLNDEFNFNA